MSHLQTLREAQSLDDVAKILNYTPAGLAFNLYKLPVAAKYTVFEIPKRGGGKRTIKAPSDRLALLQRRLANLLTLCLEEIEKNNPQRRSLAHGFERRRSIITNAALHRRRRYVLNLDLADFFPSINFGRVRGFFIRDRYFGLHEKVATVLAQIACHENELPQGSPCSPILSNLIGHLLDTRLARFAKIHKCTYSRYADDITFSTNRKDFPPELAAPDGAGVAGTWALGEPLVAKIEAAGFKINAGKTRMQITGSRQVVTGLLTNVKVNVRPEYSQTVRAMCHRLFATGSYHRDIPAGLAGGKPGDPPVRKVLTGLAPLEGMLAHIDLVRTRSDVAQKIKPDTKEERGFRKLHANFLFYKSFMAPLKPLLLPEGKTDPIYLRAAIEHLPQFHPQLGGLAGGKFMSAIRFMTYPATSHRVLKLGASTGYFVPFVAQYHNRAKVFGHKPMAFPVIILVDNDEGGKQVFAAANKLASSPITLSSSAPFYHLGLNLYLVKTPEPGGNQHSRVEDLFPADLLDTKLNGKSFDPDKLHDEESKYGKFKFAEQVVRPNAAGIDFSGFVPLLERIASALTDYKARLANIAAAAAD